MINKIALLYVVFVLMGGNRLTNSSSLNYDKFDDQLQTLSEPENRKDFDITFNQSGSAISNKSDLTKEAHMYLDNEVYSLPVKVTLSTLATTTSLITVSGNLLVMFSFFLDKQIRNPTNYFILSLSVSDFLIGLFSMPSYTLYLMLGEWPFGEVLCNLWLSLDYTVCLTSIYTVLSITIDRFCSVKIPAKYRKWRSPNKIIIMIAITWIVPISIFFTSVFASTLDKEFDQKNCNVVWSPIFDTMLQIFYFWVTLFVIIVLYMFIYQVARDLEKKHRDKQTKVNALVVGSVFKSNQTKFDKTSISENKNLVTKTLLSTAALNQTIINKEFKIPSTIPERSITKDEMISKMQKNVAFPAVENVKEFNQDLSSKIVVPTNATNLNSSFTSEFSTDSEIDLKNKTILRPDSLAVETSKLDDINKCASIQTELSLSNPIDCIEIVQKNQEKIRQKNDSRPLGAPNLIPFIDEEFEELNYVLHRRQYDKEKSKPIKEETILIKPPVKNGFFQKISLSVKSFSRRSSLKSLIDIKSNNDSNVKIKQDSLNAKSDKLKQQLETTNELKEETVLLKNDEFTKETKYKKKPLFYVIILFSQQDQEINIQSVKKKNSVTNESNQNQKNILNINAVKKENSPQSSQSCQSQAKRTSVFTQKLSLITNNISNFSSSLVKSKNKNLVKNGVKKPIKFENRARKALRTITFILGAFVFCFAPFHVMKIIENSCSIIGLCDLTSSFYLHLYNTCYFLCYLNSPINPFMYAMANQQFKKTFLRILKGDFRRT